jgi:O-antigen/teichoic acid export membrane protein
MGRGLDDERVGASPGEAQEMVEPFEEPPLRPPGGFRARTAQGVLINSAFRIGLATLNLGRNLAIAAFLTPEEYGLWGLIVTTLITLAFLKQVGIADKFIQQKARDQQVAFQKAFTFELAYTGLFFVVVLMAIPLYALVVYDRPDVLLPALVLSVSLFATAFQSPIWVFYRRMQYFRQRVLESVDPVTTTVVTVALVVAGMGHWGLVVGAVVGSAAGSAVAVGMSPYPLRLRWDRDALREYVGFSWPLLFSGLGGLLVVQGALIVGNAALGLAAVGMIGLAGNFSSFANRVELLLRRTMYPAICAVQDRVEVVRETFVKSNRLGLMWALPFGAAMSLFAADLVHRVIGDRWEGAIPLLQIFGAIFAFGTIGFAWATFYQATGNTKPIAVSTAFVVLVFFAITVPLILTIGLMGYAYGMAVSAVCQFGVRAYYLRRLFPDFNLLTHGLRALVPVLPAVVSVGAVRLLTLGDERTGAVALGELALFIAVAAISTYLIERRLIGEAVGYLRAAVTGRARAAPA